ncbi:MAG: 16S rRNA (cytidine(1402)-2'-O)-methyltransferase [Chloroflexota bacterium]|nr:16S rRNA (cytidine(1402)-2'-O)-methyltransferase [Chloroflexota bacterium]
MAALLTRQNPGTPDDRASGRGRLRVVGTPIGNLGDLSPRAADALRDADLIVAEDTRVARRLVAAIDARRPTLSFNEHNATMRLPGLVARLAAGDTLALTTDAGMPGVSDPGATLVAAARNAGALVDVVPGPSAPSAAMAVSGVDAAGFLFAGFLPARPAAARTAALDRMRAAAAAADVPLVLFEATHRIRALLGELVERAPYARLVLCRELTKLHEEVVAGSPAEVAAALADERGEFVVIIDERAVGVMQPEWGSGGRSLDVEALVRVGSEQGLADRTLVELLRAAGVARREAYAVVTGARRAAESR